MTILLLSILLYYGPYSIAKTKPLQHLLKSSKHPQTSYINISYMIYQLFCVIIFLYQDVPHLTATKSNSNKFHHLKIKLSLKVLLAIFCYQFVLTESFFALSEDWELVISN